MKNATSHKNAQPNIGPLSGTEPLSMQGDLAAQMVAGIDRYLMRKLQHSNGQREKHWKRDFSSHGTYTESVAPNRRRLVKYTGCLDPRQTVVMELVHPLSGDGRGLNFERDLAVGEGKNFRVFAVRWSVLKNVHGEGLLLIPAARPVADIVALPDCDWTPEMLVGLTSGVPQEAQFARRLAENGCRVLVPTLINRKDTWSSVAGIMTNQPHREFIYRAAFEMGRHLIGFEVQKVLAAVDWFLGVKREQRQRPVGVIGYGEGALIALHAAAVDTRIDAAVVSGYFQPREAVWEEPIYRNVFALLHEFGDAEIASLITPRSLIVEACRHPELSGPPEPSEGRVGAAPGAITTPGLAEVESEVERARQLVAGLHPAPRVLLVQSDKGHGLPGSDKALASLLKALGVRRKLSPLGDSPKLLQKSINPEARLKQQFDELVEHTQYLMREGEFTRVEFWKKADATNVETWERSCRPYRKRLWEDVIGRLPEPMKAINSRTRLVYDEPEYVGYEVVLDVYRDVYAYGILLLPKSIKPRERRPVVVCQHGLEGRPQDVANPKEDNEYYHQFACRLARRGFVTYSPQNPYIGMDDFRVLQRKANPLKLSLFSIIVRQHEQTLRWLSSLPFVDPERMAFYGLSYGGKTAMRVPALLEQYCLSICSGDFDEWIWKNTSTRHAYSYMRTGEYEMFEFDLGNTFNYAEMSWLICPRPFMVERGHFDGVASDEWVAYEYAKTRFRYDTLGLGDRTEIEFFNGPHCINGERTYEFLHRHLNWPRPEE